MKSWGIRHRRRGLQAALLIGVFLNTAGAQAAPTISASLTGSAQVTSEQEGNRFGCNDKIYAAIDVLDLDAGEHTLTADWIDPTGKTREHIDYPFSGGGTTRITIWLKLHPPKGSTLFGFFNPSMGMEDFIGNWRLLICVDDDAELETAFEVVC